MERSCLTWHYLLHLSINKSRLIPDNGRFMPSCYTWLSNNYEEIASLITRLKNGKIKVSLVQEVWDNLLGTYPFSGSGNHSRRNLMITPLAVTLCDIPLSPWTKYVRLFILLVTRDDECIVFQVFIKSSARICIVVHIML